jgi:hypothetical protein
MISIWEKRVVLGAESLPTESDDLYAAGSGSLISDKEIRSLFRTPII